MWMLASETLGDSEDEADEEYLTVLNSTIESLIYQREEEATRESRRVCPRASTCRVALLVWFGLVGFLNRRYRDWNCRTCVFLMLNQNVKPYKPPTQKHPCFGIAS